MIEQKFVIVEFLPSNRKMILKDKSNTCKKNTQNTKSSPILGQVSIIKEKGCSRCIFIHDQGGWSCNVHISSTSSPRLTSVSSFNSSLDIRDLLNHFLFVSSQLFSFQPSKSHHSPHHIIASMFLELTHTLNWYPNDFLKEFWIWCCCTYILRNQCC